MERKDTMKEESLCTHCEYFIECWADEYGEYGCRLYEEDLEYDELFEDDFE